ncbi:MAG: acyl carrier protein [Lachnospiraceae bacterium]|nr:acyl carrier protein [Lachnospiraceae bacterium]
MLEKVIDILSEFTMLGKDKMSEQSSLVIDLGLNSLDVINVVVAFEEEFNIEIPDQKIKDLATVGDIVSYLKTYV